MDRPVILHARCIGGKGGGPEKTILNSPPHLHRMGYVAHCAYLHSPQDGPAIVARGKSVGTEILSIVDNGAMDFSLVRRMTDLCDRYQIDIWHGHDYKTDLLGWLVCRRRPMKLVTTVHGWVEHTWRTPLYYAIDRWAIRRYDQVICVSSDLHDQCRRLGIADDRCHLIDNAIDTDDFRRSHDIEQARAKWSAANPEATLPSGFAIGAMGRLSPEKGFLHLIDAVAQLRQAGQDVHLLIAGEGGQREALHQRIEQCGLSDHVHLLGHVSDIKLFFQCLDLFVLSSLREGLPNVVLEAMALEVPVVATRIAGVPKLITDGVNGSLIEPESVPELVGAISAMIQSGDQRSRYAARGRQTIEQSFSFADRMRRVSAVYQRVMET